MPGEEFNDLKKQIRYPNPLFPFAVTPYTVAHGSPDLLFHWHADMELIYVHEGSGRFHIAYQYFNSEPGDIILIKPNALHAIHPLPQTLHRFDLLHFHLDLVGNQTQDQVTLNYLAPLRNGQLGLAYCIKPGQLHYEVIQALLFQLFDLQQQQPPAYELLVKAKLQELLYYLFDGRYAFPKTVSQSGYRKEAKLREVLDYITHHHQQPIQVEQLAQMCGYSPTHFMNFFKKNTGLSCMDYIIQYRLGRAAELLEQSNQAILDIAQRVGFNNLSNFNRQFKKIYHMTPSQYRKNAQV